MRQRGLPVILDHCCGVPIAVEGLGDMHLLSILVRRRHADHVCSGEERAIHSDLVRQRMVGVEVQIPVCVGLSWRGVIERQGEETLNRNGLRLLGLCATNNLVILDTFSQHKAIHKFTWESRGRGLRSIISYFVVGRES